MGYHRPCDAAITSTKECPELGTWRGHRFGIGRKKPSDEAGVDYACSSGTPLHAPADGVVFQVKDTNSDATGRFLTLDLDDGKRVRWLHLSSQQFPATGTRFERGQLLAHSGASAGGKDQGVDSHVHVTLWPGHFYDFGVNCNTLDFHAHVDGGAARKHQEDTMAYPILLNGKHRFLLSVGSIKHFTDVGASDLTRDIVAAEDAWIPLDTVRFQEQLDSFGIPRGKVDIDKGWVFDVLQNELRSGGWWSWAREAEHNSRLIREHLGI